MSNFPLRLIWLFNQRGVTLMELYYFGHFIDHWLSLEEICLSTSNATKWKRRWQWEALCSHWLPHHTRWVFQVCIYWLHSFIENGCSWTCTMDVLLHAWVGEPPQLKYDTKQCVCVWLANKNILVFLKGYGMKSRGGGLESQLCCSEFRPSKIRKLSW